MTFHLVNMTQMTVFWEPSAASRDVHKKTVSFLSSLTHAHTQNPTISSTIKKETGAKRDKNEREGRGKERGGRGKERVGRGKEREGGRERVMLSLSRAKRQ